MAHNININLNKASFYSARELPWHNLGQITTEAKTSKEAIQLAGLDYEVGTGELFGCFPLKGERGDEFLLSQIDNIDPFTQIATYANCKSIKIPNRVFTYRKDNNKYLGGIVSNQYQVVQNAEAFEFMDSLVIDGQLTYETAGALGDGETIFISCKLPGHLLVNKDQIDKYLLLKMSHDGTSSIKILFTPIRVVCNNTLSMALRSSKTSVSIRHSSNYQQRMDEAKRILTTGHKTFEEFEFNFNSMAKQKISDTDVQKILYKTFTDNKEWKQLKDGADFRNVISTRKQNIIKDVWKSYQVGVGQEDIKGTGYGLYNGVTNYFQNIKKYSSGEQQFNTMYKNDVNSVVATIANYALNPDLVNV